MEERYRAMMRALAAGARSAAELRPDSFALKLAHADFAHRAGPLLGMHAQALAGAEDVCRRAMAAWLLSTAITYGERALEMGSSDTAVRCALAKAYLSRNPYGDDHKRAIVVLQPLAAQRLGFSADVPVILALAYAYAGDHAKAVEWCDNALALGQVRDSRCLLGDVHWARGFAELRAGRKDDAAATLRRGIALWNDEMPIDGEAETYCKLWNVLGTALLGLDQAEAAEAALDRTIDVCTTLNTNPLGKAIALGVSARSMLKRAKLVAQPDARVLLLREARRRLLLNDQLSSQTCSLQGLLGTPVSLGDVARELGESVALAEHGRTLAERGVQWGELGARLVGLAMQVEATGDRALRRELELLLAGAPAAVAERPDVRAAMARIVSD